MMSSDQIVRNDPVLKEVMRKHDLQWSAFIEREDKSLYLTCTGMITGEGGRTAGAYWVIEIDTEQMQWSMSISWHVSGKSVRYDLDKEGAIITFLGGLL